MPTLRVGPEVENPAHTNAGGRCARPARHPGHDAVRARRPEADGGSVTAVQEAGEAGGGPGVPEDRPGHADRARDHADGGRGNPGRAHAGGRHPGAEPDRGRSGDDHHRRPGSGPPGGVVTTYLADLEPTQSSRLASTDEANINGKTFVHNVLFYACCDPASADYDLGRHYRRLEATLGVTDEAPADARSTFEVFLDGRKAYTATAGLGKPARLSLDVTGVLRLHLVINSTQEDFLVAWGEAKILGLPGEVPETTAAG